MLKLAVLMQPAGTGYMAGASCLQQLPCSLPAGSAAAELSSCFLSTSPMSAAPQVIELLEAAEAKAYYGLAINWKPLEALSTALLERGVLQGKEVGGGPVLWAWLGSGHGCFARSGCCSTG